VKVAVLAVAITLTISFFLSQTSSSGAAQWAVTRYDRVQGWPRLREIDDTNDKSNC
jgi:hypothetical protein